MSDMKTFNTEKKIRKKKKIPVEYPMYAVFPQGEMAIAVATLFRRDASDLNRSCTNCKTITTLSTHQLRNTVFLSY